MTRLAMQQWNLRLRTLKSNAESRTDFSMARDFAHAGLTLCVEPKNRTCANEPTAKVLRSAKISQSISAASDLLG